MAEQEKKLMRHMGANIVILIVAVFAILLLTQQENYARQMQQINQYIGELSDRTAQHAGDVFQDRQDAISSIAYLYGQAMTSSQVDMDDLQQLEARSGFDRIHFVNASGESYTSDGKLADVADRDYFIRGIAGETGRTVVMRSRFNGGRLVGFFAPVYYHNELCGVMVGFLNQSTVAKVLSTDLYGCPADTYVMDGEGVTLGSSVRSGREEARTLDTLADRLDEGQESRVRAALADGDRIRFAYEGDHGRSFGYVVPIGSTGWSVLQIFPSQALRTIVNQVNQDEHFALLLLGAAVVWFAVQLVYITKRKTMMEHRKEGRERMISLLEGVADDYLCLIDVDLTTRQEEQFRLYQGTALADWAQGDYDYEHCIESYAQSVVSPADRERFLQINRLSNLKKVLPEQKTIYIEYDAVLSGQPRRLLSKNTLDLSRPGQPHMLVGIRDVTEQTLAMKKAKEAAESANRAKSTFLFNMSHDIRTPLNAIMGFSAMAEKYVDQPDRVRDCLEKINLSGEHLLRLIGNVLDMARIESGKSRLDLRAHHIPKVLRDVECIFAADVSKKGLKLEVSWDVQNEIAFFDALKMKQIELNILSNAVKYTPAGGSIRYVVRQLGPAEHGRAVYRSTVTDTGVGMSQEFCRHVFDAFERERDGASAQAEGSGLGLAITKRLVEEMGGTISCRSQLGKGSEFIWEIPLQVGTQDDLDRETPPRTKALNASGLRVLLVEDNRLNMEISRDLLESDGFTVEEAENGAVAVDKVKAAPGGYYDLVLMDIQMPVMDGYAAARAIRVLPDKGKAAVPIIAVTANAFEEDRQAALDAGMNGHIPKPIDVDLLRQQLGACLKKQK